MQLLRRPLILDLTDVKNMCCLTEDDCIDHIKIKIRGC